MADQVPPSGITERFRPEEQATFKLLRRRGACSLWRSQTVEHQILGYTRPPRVHYHLAVSQAAQFVLMPRLKTAVLNFNLVVQNANEGHGGHHG